jgi:3-deoxy-7-phosphoheptulonate synthase
MSQPLDDLRIDTLRPLISPALLEDEISLTPSAVETITKARKIASDIVKHKDDRLLVIVGPCSIHDQKSALEYGSRLAELIKKYHKELCIVMRVYFEKPRTTVGWKGLINDPYLDDSFNINQGLRIARKLLRDLNTMGVPCATEFLDTIIPQYISDLISWGAIGARTTESQIHRELASGLSMPIGFKNGTDGNIQIAIDAMRSASYPHHFLGVTKAGLAAIVATKGNDETHVILRGATQKTNYDAESVAHVSTILQKNKLIPSLMVDCSHGNSLKDHLRQPLVVKDVAHQIAEGSKSILGIMIESHINPGRQDLKNKAELEYGQSITDACIGWHETVMLLDLLAKAVNGRRT